MSSILHTLNAWDTEAFLFLNGAHNGFWDFIMYWASDKFIWIPVYAVLLFLMWKKYKSKIWLVIIFVALLVFLSDQISVHLFKDVFQRLRPCQDPGLEGMVHLVNGHCGGKYGFYSSHASSIFAVAIFTLSLLGSKNLWLSIPVLLMAVLVSYSRIYLGVHYPGDVITGAIMGSLLAWMIARFLKNLIRKPAIAV